MVYSQRIYKLYVGQYNELVELKKWFSLFHYVLINIIKKSKCEENINEKLNLLKINYTYKQEKNLFQDCGILEFDKMYNDFNEQFYFIKNNMYLNFEDLENDKLILFNIIEAYYNKMYSQIKNDNDMNFYKLSKNRISEIIPKTKNMKILNRIVQNIFYNLFIVSFFFILVIILYIPYTYLFMEIFIRLLNLLNYLPNSLLMIFDSISKEQITEFFTYLVIVVSLIVSVLSSIFICVKAVKLRQKFIPEKGLSFARDLSENQMFLSNIAIIISFVSFVATILIAIYK